MSRLVSSGARVASPLDFASSLLEAREIEPALSAFDLAERSGCSADRCSSGRWECHMLRGDFQSAWQESDQIARRGSPDRHALWSGRSFSDRQVVIRCLHGLGDAIQFVRLASIIRAEARSVTVEVPACLVSLLRACPGVDRVVSWDRPEPYDWDEQMEVMELPRICRVTLWSIPSQIPYLSGPREALDESALALFRMGHGLKIGLRWDSGDWNLARSLPLPCLRPLFNRQGCSFYSLQAAPMAPEDCSFASMHEPIAGNLDLSRTAAILSELDLVITVDTMIAHLAGALGKPVWLLLTHAADWRWMMARSDSPWYPTMKIFRQPRNADWESVIYQVTSDLDRLLTS